ncbi:hypothetical protein BZG01_10535 [Labilibaculum manganireducens]|uniref:Uncharacterized protein n=1 Tax=Labilibaculum manganireducens TaxID=1940525 RepID=A0A2N3I8Q3_9BACT|nr:hypothetical protein [Labilibaculum manganireducens]PKQ66701.1 hypothetical protein BZG01_10535 [Labilibaculum manganireducens]
MKKTILTLTAIVFAFSTFANDILTLNNEMVFEGKVKRIKDCAIVFKSEGTKYIVPASEIYSIEFENAEDKVYTNYLEMQADEENKCFNARLDAENYHGKKGGHFVLGVLFGPFAIIGTALANPTPEKGKQTYMMSKNKDQFSDPEYLSCYRKKAKGQLIGMEALGWGAWILLVLAL